MNAKAVVDAGVAIKWVLMEPYSAQAVALLTEWANDGVSILAPSLLAFEVTNALYKRVLRRELTINDAEQALTSLLQFGPVLHDDLDINVRALQLADEFKRSAVYDAHYLALAERQACECWTADERLWNAVRDRLSWVRWIGELEAAPDPR